MHSPIQIGRSPGWLYIRLTKLELMLSLRARFVFLFWGHLQLFHRSWR